MGPHFTKIISVPASESISNSLLGDLQAPDQKAMAMNQMARDVLRDGSCVDLPTLECDQGAQFRSSNGSCNNMKRPHQVGGVGSKLLNAMHYGE
jgi:hypothetical protein